MHWWVAAQVPSQIISLSLNYPTTSTDKSRPEKGKDEAQSGRDLSGHLVSAGTTRGAQERTLQPDSWAACDSGRGLDTEVMSTLG